MNILLSLELIKHTFDYTDEILLDQYNFNYQVMYALGERNLGERHLAERTFYTFRRRIYEYTIEHPEQEDLIFGQFKTLTNHFIKELGINTQQQRMDSSFFMSNIKLAGRLSLAYDVLLQAIKACPEDILPDNLKEVLKPEFKTDLLYRSRSSQVPGRLQEMLGLSAALLELVEGKSLLRPMKYRCSDVFLMNRLFTIQKQRAGVPKKTRILKLLHCNQHMTPMLPFAARAAR